MSDGLTQANRAQCAAERILDAAEKLANALEEVRDAAFGYPPLALEIINDELRRVGVQVVSVR